MQFETFIEFNEQGFQLKIFNDKSYVYIQIICVNNPLLWNCVVDLNTLIEKFDFLEGCFEQPEDLAEYLIYMVNNGHLRLESADEESRVLNLIFWIQKEKEEEILQYEFYFSLMEEPIEIEEKNHEDQLSNNGQNNIENNDYNEIYIDDKEEEIKKQTNNTQENVDNEKKVDANPKENHNSDKREIEDDLNMLNEIEAISNNVVNIKSNLEETSNYSRNIIFDSDKAKKQNSQHEAITIKNQEEQIETELINTDDLNSSTQKNKSQENKEKKACEKNTQEAFDEKNFNNSNLNKALSEEQYKPELLKQQKIINEEIEMQRLSGLQKVQDEIGKKRQEIQDRLENELLNYKINSTNEIKEYLAKFRKEEEERLNNEIQNKFEEEQKKVKEKIEEFYDNELINVEDQLYLKRKGNEESLKNEYEEKRANLLFDLKDLKREKDSLQDLCEQLREELNELMESIEKKTDVIEEQRNQSKKILEENRKKEEKLVEEQLSIYKKQKETELDFFKSQEEIRFIEGLNKNKEAELEKIKKEISCLRKQEEEKLKSELIQRKNTEEKSIEKEMKDFKTKEEQKIKEELDLFKAKQEAEIIKNIKEKEEKLIQEEPTDFANTNAKELNKLGKSKNLSQFESDQKDKNEESRIFKGMSLERLIDENDLNDNHIHKIKCTDKSHLDLEETVVTQKNKITDLEKKIGDLIHNQNNFMGMMEKMNNLSFQILEEIKEIKEKANEKEEYNNAVNKQTQSLLSYDYSNNNFNNNKNYPRRSEKNNNYNEDDEKYLSKYQNVSTEKKLKFNEESNFKNINFAYQLRGRPNDLGNSKENLINNSHYNLNDRNHLFDEKNKNLYFDSLQEKTRSILNFRYTPERDRQISLSRKPSNSRVNTFGNNNNNNQLNEKNNASFYTNKYSNVNKNHTGHINNSIYTYNNNGNVNKQNANDYHQNFNADETINSISNDFNFLQTNLYESKTKQSNLNNLNSIDNSRNSIIKSFSNNVNNNTGNNTSYLNPEINNNKSNNNQITELLPSFFKSSKNEKLFSNFEIQEKTIKKKFAKDTYDIGFFGIRCRDPLLSLQSKYYFSVYLQSTQKSNIFLGITSDARMGIPGGFNKTPNSYMFSLASCQAFIRGEGQVSNFNRKGRSGDIYTFFVDFEIKFIKLFLNGNELSHNKINVGAHEGCFYPCIDIKDPEDSVTFVDRIILNFVN